MRILFVMLFVLFTNIAKADSTDETTFLFNDLESRKSSALKNQKKLMTNDYCFKKCGVIVYSYKECKGFAQTLEEKEMCISEGEKICLMTCKEDKLEQTGILKRLDERYQEAEEAKK